MNYKAVFLDFYGTLVYEDDEILPVIYRQIQRSASIPCSEREIGDYWWQRFSAIFTSSHNDTFQTQRAIGIQSLSQTIEHFQAAEDAEELIQVQFDHWRRPVCYADTLPFLEQLQGTPVYILSNIDAGDIAVAIQYHGIQADDVITSEDVRSYKPRPELFLEALRRLSLQPHEVIHIGDSIVSDVGGAQQLGIKAIWLNRLNKQQPDGCRPDYTCTNLEEVLSMLRAAIDEGKRQKHED
ncbi:HAD family hydrolase [Paenibacillus pinisoli]|uniref:HAD family hydrolase n=2 Tax=Paenibacillus pinisoli TaxID=1276110 RepID=A0A3A6PPE3_9BACL|nr:HAD family hydrolase [Paenibacillus pinisoli]